MSAGTRLRSVVDATEVVIVRPADGAELCCGGLAMVPMDAARTVAAVAAVSDASGVGTALGKRYVDPETGLEVLCTKAGSVDLSVAGRPLKVKTAKPLPSSD